MTSDCCICTEEIEGVFAAKTKCKHLYHEECISKWLEKSDTCPWCRVPAVKETLFKIYIPANKRNSTKIMKAIEEATSENNMTEKWDSILDVCDEIKENLTISKDYLQSIMKRMGHKDPNVAAQAVTLLDACIKNCGSRFHIEVASEEFEAEFQSLVSKMPPAITQKMCASLKCWAEGEFKDDRNLSSIPLLYKKLKTKGYDFGEKTLRQQEEDDIAKAIERSLKLDSDAKASTSYFPTESIYEELSTFETQYFDCATEILSTSSSPEQAISP